MIKTQILMGKSIKLPKLSGYNELLKSSVKWSIFFLRFQCKFWTFLMKFYKIYKIL